MNINIIKVDLLKAARKLLEPTLNKASDDCNSERYICLALSTAYMRMDCPSAGYAALCELTSLISERLGISRSWPNCQPNFEHWLQDRGFLKHRGRDIPHPDYFQLQTARLAWIDSLIEEHSAP